jgi:hypothetical protein
VKNTLRVLFTGHNILVELLFLLVLLALRYITIGANLIVDRNLLAVAAIGLLAVMDAIANYVLAIERFNKNLLGWIHNSLTIPISIIIYLYAIFCHSDGNILFLRLDSASSVIVVVYVVIRAIRGMIRGSSEELDEFTQKLDRPTAEN